MHKTAAAILDVDGTLLDTQEFIYQAYEHTFATHGVSGRSRRDMSVLMGQPLEACYGEFAPETDPTVMAETHRAWQSEHIHLAASFPHTLATLDTLRARNIKLAVVTTRSSQTSRKTLGAAGLLEYFEVVISGDDVDRHKPDPAPLLAAAERLGVSPANTVMIGDTEADIQAGKNAGMKTVGVTYGFQGERIRDSRPDMVVTDIADILDAI